MPFGISPNKDYLSWTVKPGMQQSLGSQRVRHDEATELKEYRETAGPSRTL